MQIANLQILEKFKRVHVGASKPLKEWVDKTLIADWAAPIHIKRMFASASFVKHYVIFNIGGNKYRLLTRIFYELKVVDILKIGTHNE